MGAWEPSSSQEQRRHQDEQDRLRGPCVEQDALVHAWPGHRRDRPEPKAQDDERERAARPPLAAGPPDLSRRREVPGEDQQDQDKHRDVDAPLGERTGEGQLGGATVSGRERGHAPKLLPVVDAGGPQV